MLTSLQHLCRSTSRRPAALLALALSTAMPGCADLDDAPAIDEIADELLGGVATDAHPEIGRFRGCTATLIAPQWILTAGHCLDYLPVVRSSDRFTVTRGLDGVAHAYEVDRAHVFGAFPDAGARDDIAFQFTPDGTGTNDVAIVRLASAVPASVAVPATMASGPPPAAATVTVFGYGCENRDGTGGGFKQAVTYRHGSSNVLCSGDSGGPVILGRATDAAVVFQINTGMQENPFNSWDVHGAATHFRDQIMNVILDAGFTTFETGFDRPGGDYDRFATPLVANCQRACRDDHRCRAFAYDAAGVCWVKDKVPNWVPRPGVTSGLGLRTERNIERAGSTYRTHLVGTQPAEACLSLCAEDDACDAYTYTAAAGATQALCELKAGVPGTSIRAGKTSGIRRGIEPGTDRAGWDYANFVVADRDECADRCATEARCRAFTFIGAGVSGLPPAHCWLKESVPAPSALSGAFSGVKRGLEQNTDRLGGDLTQFDLGIAVPEECQAACARDSRCKAFTYAPPGFFGPTMPRAHCWLKASVSEVSRRTGLVSGVRGGDFF